MKKFILLPYAFLLLFSGCGRKQRNIFHFPENEPIVFNKLDFPVVKQVKVTQTTQGNKISWQAIKPQQFKVKECPCSVQGYNVYRLVRTSIIPKQPLNKKIIEKTMWLDTTMPKNTKQAFYLVRALFMVNDRIIEGPISLIVSN